MKVFPVAASISFSFTIVAGLTQSVAIAQPTLTSESSPSTSTDSESPTDINTDVDTDTDTNLDSVSRTATDLRISPRMGVGHTSSGAGFDGTTRFEGFIPLRQTPGRNITFFEPRLLLDNDGNIGGNLLFGHRAYTPAMDRIWGGYVSLDNRDTDDSEFYQLGLGFETLGRVFDGRINGYVPLGDTSHTVDEQVFDTGLNISSGFEGNQLVVSSRRERQVIRVQDIALSGFDAELGARLATWNDGDGDLRAYAGLYFYDADDVDSALGWRLGLEVRPLQNLVFGITVQEDNLFGTNVIGSVSLTFPRVRPKGNVSDEDAVVARLGEPVRRTASIAIETQEDREQIIEESVSPLINPEEEDPYRFIHVSLGRRGRADGTVERPFGSVEEAIDAAISDGNTIIYVDAGRNPDIPAFTIPDQVRVLSQGPRQFIAGEPLPGAGFPELPSRLPFSPVENFDDGILVELPFSGDGNFPIIRDGTADNLVTMGDRTVLSGFRLVNAQENAVFAQSVEDVEIRDNTITQPGGRGIYLQDVTGSAILFDNTITTAQGGANSGQGILVENRGSGAIEVAIQRQELTDNRVGIEILASGDRTQLEDPSQVVEITDTTISSSTNQGLVAIANDLGNQQVSFLNGTIEASGGDGVFVQAINVGSQELTLEDSTILDSSGHGLRVEAGIEDGSSTAAQEIFIRRNQILTNAGDGISIAANEVAAQEFAITDNIIQNNGGAGIRAIANNLSFQEYVTDPDNESFGISGNTISSNGDLALSLTANDSSTLVADIQDNTLSDNATSTNPDLTITANANTVDVCMVIDGNASTTGIQLDSNSSGVLPAFFEVGDLTTLSTRNTGGITLLPDISAFTDLGSISSCFND